MLEQLIGPDIILWGSGVFYKRSGSGPATPWHRDAVLLPIKPMRTMSVWIAACDTVVDSACLRFIPGSHRKQEAGKHIEQRRSDLSFGLTLDPSEYDETTAVDIEIEAGRMVIFDGFTIHGSRSNRGDRERSSLALRFIPATCHFDHDATPAELRSSTDYGQHTRPLILARGVDRANNDFQRGHPA